MDVVISLFVFVFFVLLLLAAYAISEGEQKDVIAIASLFGGLAVSVLCLLLGWTIEATDRTR